MSSTDIELKTIPQVAISTERERTPTSRHTDAVDMEDGNDLLMMGEDDAVGLHPVDRGKHAYLFLGASFVFEALIWGFPFTFGVFQKYYSTHEPFAGARNIPVVGTCASGIMYLDVPIMMGLMRRFPHWTRWAPMIGVLGMSLSFALSSFSNTIGQLIATQGILYAITGTIAYCPCILYLDEWFVRRKGLAYGIMWSGTGLAGGILPFLMEYLLESFGFRTTLRIWSVVLFVMTMPLAYFIKGRLPMAATTHLRPLNLRFVFTRVFAVHQFANMVNSIGYFLPAVYLPSFAEMALGASAFPSALTLTLINVASVFGCVAMGGFIDRFDVTTCLFVSALGTVIGVLLIWGLSSSLPVLYLFCLVYGLFAGSFSAGWTGIMRQVAGSQRSAGFDPLMVFGLLSAGRGVGNIAAGPLSEALIKGYPWRGDAFAGYGSGYGGLIVFTGVTALFGGSSFFWRRIGWI